MSDEPPVDREPSPLHGEAFTTIADRHDLPHWVHDLATRTDALFAHPHDTVMAAFHVKRFGTRPCRDGMGCTVAAASFRNLSAHAGGLTARLVILDGPSTTGTDRRRTDAYSRRSLSPFPRSGVVEGRVGIV